MQIFDDLNPDQIEATLETAIRRDVDTELVRADKEGEYLFMPTVSLVFMLIVRRQRENLYKSAIQHLRLCHWRDRFAGRSKSSLNITAII